ncbi:glycoside hydrolase family 52 protein [Sorangium sp. So ce1000]|uniref:glycoside hydrolase family 52 protein n=1 Tax=Sorangium sp. So ce1000 TaxID=3133325 RepID=UPI003F5FCC4C
MGCSASARPAARSSTSPPGARREVWIALGFYDAGTITTGIEARYAYTRCVRKLEDASPLRSITARRSSARRRSGPRSAPAALRAGSPADPSCRRPRAPGRGP